MCFRHIFHSGDPMLVAKHTLERTRQFWHKNWNVVVPDHASKLVKK